MKDATNGRRRFVATAGFAALAATLGEALTGREVQAHDDRDVDKFIRAVQKARIFDLSHTWDESSPIAGVNPTFSMTLDPAQGAANHASTRGTFGDDGQLSFAGEVMRWRVPIDDTHTMHFTVEFGAVSDGKPVAKIMKDESERGLIESQPGVYKWDESIGWFARGDQDRLAQEDARKGDPLLLAEGEHVGPVHHAIIIPLHPIQHLGEVHKAEDLGDALVVRSLLAGGIHQLRPQAALDHVRPLRQEQHVLDARPDDFAFA